MLAVFKPVKNAYWFEIREVYFWKKKVATQALTISDYVWTMWEFPIFKPQVACNSMFEYYQQFEPYKYEIEKHSPITMSIF